MSVTAVTPGTTVWASAAATSTTGASRPRARSGSLVVATLIFLWLTRIPRCAISALSTLRTVCFGDTASLVSRWISSTEPVGPATTRTLITPGSVASNSSARWIGNTLPAIGENSAGGIENEKLAGADTETPAGGTPNGGKLATSTSYD